MLYNSSNHMVHRDCLYERLLKRAKLKLLHVQWNMKWTTGHHGMLTIYIIRSRMSPKPATNSHMTGAPKLETVAVHKCGKNGVKCRRFWRRLIGFIKSPLANRIYPRLYREKFEAFLRHISNFLPCTFWFLPWLFCEKKF